MIFCLRGAGGKGSIKPKSSLTRAKFSGMWDPSKFMIYTVNVSDLRRIPSARWGCRAAELTPTTASSRNATSSRAARSSPRWTTLFLRVISCHNVMCPPACAVQHGLLQRPFGGATLLSCERLTQGCKKSRFFYFYKSGNTPYFGALHPPGIYGGAAAPGMRGDAGARGLQAPAGPSAPPPYAALRGSGSFAAP